MSTRVLIIRHGESTWNAERRWQGHENPPLSRLGERQAFEAAQRLGAFDAIIASDLQRAALTAQIIADQLAIGPVIGDERFRETFAGDWQGLTADQINNRYPGYLEQHRRPDNFEPAEHVAERVTAALVDLTRLCPDGEVLVVSHGGVVRAITRLNGGHETHVPNLGGGWFDISSNGTLRVGPTVDLLGDWDEGGLVHAPNDSADDHADDDPDGERV